MRGCPTLYLTAEVFLGWNSGNDVGLDAAVILPAQDLEGAVVAPVVVPGVGHEPEGRAALHAPTQNPLMFDLLLRSDYTDVSKSIWS